MYKLQWIWRRWVLQDNFVYPWFNLSVIGYLFESVLGFSRQGWTIGFHIGCSFLHSADESQKGRNSSPRSHMLAFSQLLFILVHWQVNFHVIYQPSILVFLFIYFVADRSFQILHITAFCTRSFIQSIFYKFEPSANFHIVRAWVQVPKLS